MASEAMEDLAQRYADQAVRSVFLYTREAHPGENYRHHTSMDDKRAVARAFKEHSNIKREILLDDLIGVGSVSARAAFVIDKEGIVQYAEQTATPLELPNFDSIKETLATLN